MRKLILVLFLLSVSAIYAQRTIDLPISSVIDTVDRFTTLYRPSAPTTLRQVTFKTVRDYFWNGINHWKNSNTWIDTVGVTTNLINVLLVKGVAGADANVTAGKYITHVTNNDNTTAIGLYAKAMGGTTNYAAYFDSGSVFVKKDLFVADSTFKISTTGNIKKWRNKPIEDIPLTDSTKVLYSNGKWKIVAPDSSLKAKWLIGGGVYSLPYQAKTDSTLFFTPTLADTNKFLQYYSGGWRLATAGGGSSIDTTKISYLAKNETFTGAKTFNGDLIFGASWDLTLPTADPAPDVGKLWRSTDILKYTNSAGDVKTLTIGSGTANEIAYWAGTNTLGTLPTASYPSLIELSYVKGLSSAVQTQLGGKLGTGLTNTYLFIGNGSNIATGVAMSGDATISNLGVVTVADDSHAHTSATVSSAATATTSTNLAGGGAYYVPYQTSANNTSFIAPSGLSSAFTYTSGGGLAWLGYTNANTVSTLVWRDGSGNFSAGTITATLSGNASTATTATSATTTTNIAGGGAYYIPYQTSANNTSLLAPSGLSSALTYTSGGGLAWLGYTNANTVSTLVWRDASGNFSAGTITASLSGNASTVTNGVYTSRSISTTSPLSGGGNLSADRTLTIAGLSSLGADGQLIRVNSGATAWEYFTPDYASLSADITFTGDVSFDDAVILKETAVSDTDTDIDATDKSYIRLGYLPGSYSITTISNGIAGQVLVLCVTSSGNTWTVNNGTGANNIRLNGAANYAMGQYDTLTIIYDSGAGAWIETARSNN